MKDSDYEKQSLFECTRKERGRDGEREGQTDTDGNQHDLKVNSILFIKHM